MATQLKHQASKRWVTILTLLAFASAFLVVRWVVTTQRSPGSITVVEAQGMDMGAMRAPAGMQPVTAQIVHPVSVGGQTSFPATVMALSDAEIVARVPGRILSIAYPGDNVQGGQTIVKLDAREFHAQANQQRLSAQSSQDSLRVAQQQVERQRTMRAQAAAGVDAANAAVSKAQADLAAAAADVRERGAEAKARAAAVKDRQAESIYAGQVVARKEALSKAGAISVNEYQSAVADFNSAQARLESAKADQEAAEQAAQAAIERVGAARNEVTQAKAQVRLAQSGVRTADKDVSVALAETDSARAQALAAASQSESASTIADYTDLKAQDASMVAERYVSPGSVVTAGQKLLMLHVASSVRVQAQLPEALSMSVSVGTPVAIRYGSMLIRAKLTSLFPTADSSTRTFTAEALIPNLGHKLLPGSFATMSVQTGSSKEGLAVPTAALQTDASGRTYVWLVKGKAGPKADWTCPMHTQVSEPGPGKCPICKMELVPRTRTGDLAATRRTVTVGESDADQTSITTGLGDGDEVITSGFEGLIEGTPLKVSLGDQENRPAMTTPRSRTQVDRLKKPATQLYTCPMHPEVVLDHPGKCPKCGMDLVPKKASK